MLIAQCNEYPDESLHSIASGAAHSQLFTFEFGGQFSDFGWTFEHFQNQTKVRTLWEIFLRSIKDHLVKTIHQAKLSQRS